MAAETEGETRGFPFPGGKPAAIGALVALCVAGGAGGYVLATRGGTPEPQEATQSVPETSAPETGDKGYAKAGAEETAETDEHGKGKGKAKSTMAVTPFKEIIVNITSTTATGRTTSRFMKLNVALVYDESKDGADRIEERRLFMRDSFQDYLRQLTEHDLRSSMGLVILKEELLHRARIITESWAPSEILIADLIVQ